MSASIEQLMCDYDWHERQVHSLRYVINLLTVLFEGDPHIEFVIEQKLNILRYHERKLQDTQRILNKIDNETPN